MLIPDVCYHFLHLSYIFVGDIKFSLLTPSVIPPCLSFICEPLILPPLLSLILVLSFLLLYSPILFLLSFVLVSLEILAVSRRSIWKKNEQIKKKIKATLSSQRRKQTLCYRLFCIWFHQSSNKLLLVEFKGIDLYVEKVKNINSCISVFMFSQPTIGLTF